jgi:LacI family transcriptional regulator
VAFSAISCANDLLALGALDRLAQLEIAVPADVSVAGFDDVQTAAIVAPSLTTVRLPLHEMGARAFAFAEAVLAGERPQREVLATEVVMRASTAPPAVTGVVADGVRPAS